MQVTPAAESPAKRSRAKAKEGAATSPAEKKPSRSRKKPAPPADVEILALLPAPPAGDELNGMIATAAYFLAAQRHFQAGHELDDWLEAERQVRAQWRVD